MRSEYFLVEKSNSQKVERFKAFTLAEVLITLGVVGIVAAITVPTLIANSQKKEFTTSFKKFYTNTTQALQLMANDYGCPGNLPCTGIFDSTSGGYPSPAEKSIRILAQYLKGSSVITDKSLDNYKRLQGLGNVYTVGWTYYVIYLNDGSFILLGSAANNCVNIQNGGASVYPACAMIRVDVNGNKGPNQLGRDFFELYVLPNATLFPSGGIGSNRDPARNWYDGTPNYHCRPEVLGDTLGRSCSGRIIEEGWEMNY